jgi:hypothetical protein
MPITKSKEENMNSNTRRWLVTLTLGLGLALAFVWVLDGQSIPAAAAPATTTRYVDGATGSDDSDCSDPGDPCQTIQYAVDGASDGDEILVATGVYTGVSVRPRDDITTTGVVTQVVYISKTVTIRGGYTAAFTGLPDPETNETTVDAQGEGRVLYVVGSTSPTVEGLRITGGDATGLDGDPWYGDAGGGIYVYTATPTVSNCVVYSNTASTTDDGAGGGLALYSSATTLSGNTVQDNIASTGGRGWGGGLNLWSSPATLSGNTVQSNTASVASHGDGGGLSLWWYSAATLISNTVQGNTGSTVARSYGGGLYIDGSAATLSGNIVQGNTASTAYEGYGGGLSLWQSPATLSGNEVVSNTATLSPTSSGWGGGLWARGGRPFTLTNNLVADNHANTGGSGLWLDGFSWELALARLLYNTIADNHGSGQGVFVDEYATLAFTNTIIAGHHSVGITVTAGSTVTLEATLWHDNGATTGGRGAIFTGTVNVYDSPAFADPSAWDYHLTASSAAIDAGVEAGVTTDIDGDPRPQNGIPDIGADEFVLYEVYLPLVLRQ